MDYSVLGRRELQLHLMHEFRSKAAMVARRPYLTAPLD